MTVFQIYIFSSTAFQNLAIILKLLQCTARVSSRKYLNAHNQKFNHFNSLLQTLINFQPASFRTSQSFSAPCCNAQHFERRDTHWRLSPASNAKLRFTHCPAAPSATCCLSNLQSPSPRASRRNLWPLVCRDHSLPGTSITNELSIWIYLYQLTHRVLPRYGHQFQ